MMDAAAFPWRRTAAPPTIGGLRDGRPGIALWSASVLFVLLCHALAAWALLASRDPQADMQQPLPAIVMDLAPSAMPPAAVPPVRPAAPQPPQTQQVSPPGYRAMPHPPAPHSPAPQVKSAAPELPPIPAEAALPRPKPHSLKPQPPKSTPAEALPPRTDTAPAPQRASRMLPAKAPADPAPTQSAAQPQQAEASAAAVVAAKSNWLGDVVQHIAKFKRTPRSRLRRPLRAVIGFEINRDGRLLSQHVLQSSGRDEIDEEALAWIRRADPLPKPPQEISEADLSHGFAIPVDFMPR